MDAVQDVCSRNVFIDVLSATILIYYVSIFMQEMCECHRNFWYLKGTALFP